MSETEIENSQKYTKSALVEKLANEFKDNKEFEKLIYKLQFEKSVLVLNPSKFPTLLEVSASSPDEITLYVKDAVIVILSGYSVPEDRLQFVKDNFKLQLVLNETIPLDRLTAMYENALVQTIAQVVSVGRRQSYIKEIHYRCNKCEKEETRRIEELSCVSCGKKMEILETVFGDVIEAELQQPYDEVVVQPSTYTAQFYDDDVFTLQTGDIKKLCIIRTSLIKKNQQNRKIMLKVLSSVDATKKTPKMPDKQLKEKLHDLTKKDFYLDFITKCVSPNILYQDLAKLACLLAVIGGTPTSGNRSMAHAMICGDPSEAKSTIIKFFTRLPYQKAGYAVGNQASGQGITVAMTKLGDGTTYPKAGLLTLCTDGYIGLDELNLIKPEELDKVRECAEDGELSYNKGGFNLKLTANTTILAGLNPKWHTYDFDKSMKDNLNIPIPLLSRFDIKVNITSPRDISRERKIIEHIYDIKSSGVDEYIENHSLLTAEEISMFINYAKTFKPVTPDNIAKQMIEFYIQQKDLEYAENIEDRGMLRIDRRTGRALRTIAEAFARAHLSNEVTEYHASLAIKFAKDCIRTFGFDPELGLVQSSMRESDFSQKTAFEDGCQRLEGKSETRDFNEQEITEFLMKEFPTLFKQDHEVHTMWKKFDEWGRFTSRAGRYKLI